MEQVDANGYNVNTCRGTGDHTDTSFAKIARDFLDSVLEDVVTRVEQVAQENARTPLDSVLEDVVKQLEVERDTQEKARDFLNDSVVGFVEGECTQVEQVIQEKARISLDSVLEDVVKQLELDTQTQALEWLDSVIEAVEDEFERDTQEKARDLLDLEVEDVAKQFERDTQEKARGLLKSVVGVIEDMCKQVEQGTQETARDLLRSVIDVVEDLCIQVERDTEEKHEHVDNVEYIDLLSDQPSTPQYAAREFMTRVMKEVVVVTERGRYLKQQQLKNIRQQMKFDRLKEAVQDYAEEKASDKIPTVTQLIIMPTNIADTNSEVMNVVEYVQEIGLEEVMKAVPSAPQTRMQKLRRYLAPCCTTLCAIDHVDPKAVCKIKTTSETEYGLKTSATQYNISGTCM